MPRITVKAADSPAELETACQIWARANLARPRPAGAVRAARVRDKIHAGDLVLLAWYGDRPAGMLLAEQFVDQRPDPDCGHIAMVFVDPAVWGSGVGSKMLRALQEREWDRLSVWTRSDNQRAQRLYQTVGFTDTGNRAHLQDGDVIIQLLWSRRQTDEAPQAQA